MTGARGHVKAGSDLDFPTARAGQGRRGVDVGKPCAVGPGPTRLRRPTTSITIPDCRRQYGNKRGSPEAAHPVARVALRGTRRSSGPRIRALLVGATVSAHFFLDALVHVAGLPVLGPGSYRVGLGLWRHTGLELAVERGLGAVGWWMHLGSSRAARGAARWGLGGIVVFCALLTILGGLTTTPPPSAGAMAAVSLVTIGVITALAAGWIAPPPSRESPARTGPAIVRGLLRTVS